MLWLWFTRQGLETAQVERGSEFRSFSGWEKRLKFEYMKYLWDYKLPRNWKPNTQYEWEWYLVRKINYGDFKGLKKTVVKKYFKRIKDQLDPGKREMLEDFFKNENLK